MITKRALLAAAAAAPWASFAAGAQETSGALTIEELVRPATVRGAALSPNGRLVALLREQRAGERRVAVVLLLAADDLTAPPRQVVLGDFDVDRLYWANDERLLISIFVKRQENYVPTGSHQPLKLDTSFRRMMSVGLDDQPPVLLFGDQTRVLRSNFDLGSVVDLLPNDDRHVLMRLWDPASGVRVLHAVDVYTGASTLFERGNAATYTWFVQNGRPMLRWDYNARGTVASLYARAPDASDWRLVRKLVMRTQIRRPDLDIVGPTDEAGVFLAIHRTEDEPVASLKRFDLRDLTFGETVSARPGLDVDGALVDDQGRFVAARYVEDRFSYDFADESLAPHFRGVESFFGRKMNVRLVQVDRSGGRFVIHATSPQQPSAFYLYDVAARRLSPLAAGRPWLGADRLAPMESLDVRTRDGASIRAYLTVPRGDGPRPLVVMPHGGPEIRDRWDFDLFAQAFAAQGWLVLQPNFRGSGGYGRDFAAAGRRRWGGRMQEDVEDAVDQVVAAGRVDPQRIAICGASYGGYAALMGAVRRPGLYRAAVSIAGVSDLIEVLEDVRRSGEDAAIYQYWVETIGDPQAEKPRLIQESPRHRAGEIQVPVLLIHGTEDQVVRPAQSRIMAGALKSAGKRFEHVEIAGMDHGGWEPTATRRVLETSVAFIAKAFA
ncbi:MAG: alpha/beta hydrolase family protein [Phenylobacterium sp.]|uniref:alpha/beta hydrolase family protein n=1 Tax=Phenylobacterium sp. TaxID=1871053 RepID=UPI00391A4413